MNRESRDHGNIGHARYRTKRNKAKTQNRHNTKKTLTPPKTGVISGARAVPVFKISVLGKIKYKFVELFGPSNDSSFAYYYCEILC